MAHRAALCFRCSTTRAPVRARDLLRKWILQPLLSIDTIARRQDAVGELLDNILLRRDVRDLLKGIGDIERLVSRAVTGQGNARDLVALAQRLANFARTGFGAAKRRRGGLDQRARTSQPNAGFSRTFSGSACR